VRRAPGARWACPVSTLFGQGGGRYRKQDRFGLPRSGALSELQRREAKASARTRPLHGGAACLSSLPRRPRRRRRPAAHCRPAAGFACPANGRPAPASESADGSPRPRPAPRSVQCPPDTPLLLHQARPPPLHHGSRWPRRAAVAQHAGTRLPPLGTTAAQPDHRCGPERQQSRPRCPPPAQRQHPRVPTSSATRRQQAGPAHRPLSPSGPSRPARRDRLPLFGRHLPPRAAPVASHPPCPSGAPPRTPSACLITADQGARSAHPPHHALAPCRTRRAPPIQLPSPSASCPGHGGPSHASVA